MAFIRNCFVIVLTLFCIVQTNAQTVYYPAQSSRLLKSTAEDMAMLLQKRYPAASLQFLHTLYFQQQVSYSSMMTQ